MAKPTTIRVPEELLEEIDRLVRELDMDRSAYLREILRKGLAVDKQERLLDRYARKELSLSALCEALGCHPWEILELLRNRNLYLSVDLEDWLQSSRLP